jgi:hypothetical protein
MPNGTWTLGLNFEWLIQGAHQICQQVQPAGTRPVTNGWFSELKMARAAGSYCTTLHSANPTTTSSLKDGWSSRKLLRYFAFSQPNHHQLTKRQAMSSFWD